ncbi:MAG: carboxypeptidase-like regulatory domain-containing protein [Flammeovirgaceae bacterium]|nr:MAG: carboxypeptidase-like regulatory domain-containing protein [Flammeovirgaceae bacterium]
MYRGLSIGLVLFLLVQSPGYSQQKVEGKIIDRETGNPIPFASIGVLGTAMGTSSNLDGEFTLLIPEGASIKVSCVGYVSLMVSSPEDMKLIRLTPFTIELSEIVVTHRPINARRVVQRAFANTNRNYENQSFLQQFFYRHYCKDDSVYGRLIEAFVDVWKHQGYKPFRKQAGEKEEMRVTQLRRSLDNTVTAQGHTPISLRSILQADLVGYQLLEKSNYLKMYEEVSNLKTDFENYTFKFEGITAFDGRDVYKISFSYKQDSILTTTGYVPAPHAKGMLYITTDTYAFVKVEELKYDAGVTVKTSAFYRKYNDKYYPYHFIREGETHFSDSGRHFFHIELMSGGINRDPKLRFEGKEPGKAELLTIPYDSGFWSNHNMLKTTPLEDRIIYDLGKGIPLSRQFDLYKKYEWSTSQGGEQADEKFNWLADFSKNRKMLYLVFWDNTCDRSCVQQLEEVKRLHKVYRNHLMVIFLSKENDTKLWEERVVRYNLFADGIVNYRIGGNSDLSRTYKIKNTPGFVVIRKDGTTYLADGGPATFIEEADLKKLLIEGN